ncbi:MAG: hypothetical protein AAF709_12835 [Pseudomonadota bacterium]
MLDRLHIFRASWTLLDQGLVSLGVFLVNVQLARTLPEESFGTFALLFGGFLALQLFNSSLLLYPMSIRLPVLEGDDRHRLLSATAKLVALATVPLSGVLAIGLYVLGRADLIVPAVLVFFCWQMQETMRRGLLAQFRHQAAIPGDVVTYYGQVAGVAALSYWGELTLTGALFVMAQAFAAGAIIQAVQLPLAPFRSTSLRATAEEYFSIGGWSLINNLVSLARIQILPWALAATGGPAAAGAFQAALNVVNISNPIILGLCNVIPQTAARAQQSGGNAEAWRAARVYMLMGVPPTFGYYALVLLVPSLFLTLFYGSDSPYTGLTTAVQILVMAWAIGYATEMTCSYLHGVNGAHLALIINSLGAVASIALAIPATQMYGLTGGCFAILGANVVRLVASQYILRRITADECTAKPAT